MAKFKKYLALTLALLLMLSLCSVAGAAEDTAEKGAPGTFDIETVCYDWGQAVEKLYLNLEDALVGATADEAKTAFAVRAVDITYFSYADMQTHTESFDREIESAEISADGKTVVLSLKTEAFDTANNVNFASYSVTQTGVIGGLAAGSIDLTEGVVFDEIADQFARYETADTGLALPYRLYKPATGSSGSKPMVVWLHGGGEFGTDNNAQLTANLVTNWASADVQAIFGGAYVLAPQTPSGRHNPENIMAVIEQVMEDNPDIDATRIYVGGCSMGGMGTWDTILAYPNFFAAAFPICPAREPSAEELETVKNMNIWIIHAAQDNTCDAALGINAYNKLIEAGAENTHFTLFDTVTFDGIGGMAGMLEHWSWVYVHRNFPSTDNVDRIVADGQPLTTANGTEYESVTSENPTAIGYTSFMHWLVAQKTIPFTDVPANQWYYGAVVFAYRNDLFDGTSPTTFSPNNNMNRAMMVRVLYNMTDGAEAGESRFDDVADGLWYSDAISWAADNEIVTGVGNNRFAPTSNITREQMALMLYNYAKAMDIELPETRPAGSFADADSISSWAVEAVDAMYAAEIINGKGGNRFDPRGTATRAQVAEMFMNFFAVTGE